jgi:hypothetical protein
VLPAATHERWLSSISTSRRRISLEQHSHVPNARPGFTSASSTERAGRVWPGYGQRSRSQGELLLERCESGRIALVARELETGTHRLAWTQSVTRSRWIAVKLGLVGLASVAVTGLFSLMVTWWSSPFDRVNVNQFTSAFDQRNIVPIGYAAFALALGVTAGVLIRRTLPAMVTTLVAFTVTRIVVTFWVRPHLMTPVRTTTVLHMSTGMGFNQTSNGPLSVTGGHPGAWVISDSIVDKAGHSVAGSFLDQGACLQDRGAPACIGSLREVLVSQPASRYWAFQRYEMAIFLSLALVLGGFCFWWIRHRVS